MSSEIFSATTRRLCSVFNSRPENEASSSVSINHSVIINPASSFFPIDNFAEENKALNISKIISESCSNELPSGVVLNDV